ncbi:MAG: hypothetical protein ACYCW6_24540, partial [Candidatus Xenobia bacterium]
PRNLGTSPASSAANVDFPCPDAPNTANTAPAGTLNRSIASAAFAAPGYVYRTPSSSSIRPHPHSHAAARVPASRSAATASWQRLCRQPFSGQIDQVILNRALNARDSIDGPGRITFEITHGSNSSILLRVIDTGCGMDESDAEILFLPKPFKADDLLHKVSQLLDHAVA